MSIKSILKKDTLVNAAIWYTIGTFVLKGVNFLTMPIFSRMLSTSEVGIFSVYSTYTAVFAVIVGIGINGTIGSARANLKEEEYEEYLSTTLFLGTLSFMIIATIMLIFRYQISNVIKLEPILIIALLFESFFSFVISFVTSVFTFDKNYRGYLLSSFLVTIINIVISIAIILSIDSNKYIGRVFGGAIATVLVGIFLYARIIRRGRKLISLKHWRFCLPIAIPLIFHNLSHLVLNQSDKIMLQEIMDESIVGIYSYTYTIGALINIVQQALNSAWLPWYYDGLKLNNKEELKKKSGMYMAAFTILTSMFILGGAELVKILGEKYLEGIAVLPIIIVGYYFVYLYTFPANYQFYKKETKFIAIGTVTAAIINIIINAILIPRQGMYGAALATLISNATLFVLHYIIVKFKFKHDDFPFSYYLYGIGTVIVVTIISYIFVDLFVIRWALILVILAVCSYFGIKVYKSFKNVEK